MVDCVSITMSMIRNPTPVNVRKLIEFNLNRAGLGRGGEHAFCRWNECTYDHFFRCADMTWHQLKTTGQQCMLFPMDFSHYCLCIYLAFAVYFMHGGIERNQCDPRVKDYVFPYLHNMKKEGVARKLTNTIRQHIDVTNMSTEDAKKHKGCYTSRSVRKGSMTENRLHPDLCIHSGGI